MRFAFIIIPFQFRLTEGQMVMLKERLYENSREMQFNNVFVAQDVISLHVLPRINARIEHIPQKKLTALYCVLKL